ncbi:MAG: hypothetical protein AB1486_30750 [Planctomycetota bacterium]
MERQRRSVGLWVAVPLAFLALAFVGTDSASALPQEPDALLQIENASLTTYLPTSASSVQNAFPLAVQRGVTIDGSMRAPSPLGMAIAGNPFRGGCGDRVGGFRSLGPIDLATGAYSPLEVDLALPAPGPAFVVARTYNAVQYGGGAHHDSSSYMGYDWALCVPELVFYDGDANKEATDFIYLVYGADRHGEFKCLADDSEIFRGVNGTAGVIQHVPDGSGEPDTYCCTDMEGTQFTFFGSDGDAGAAAGQLWKVEDTANPVNVLFVGDKDTASTAITNGFVSGTGRLSKLYDGADRRFSLSYDGNNRLTQVKAETKTGGTWENPTGLTTVGQVDLAFHDGSTSHGSAGDLEFVKVTEYLTDSGVTLVKRKMYRYGVGAYDGETNPWHPHSLKYVYDFEGVRGYDWGTDSDIDDDDLRAASNSTLEPYAEAYFEYQSDHRLSKVWLNGACACSGAPDGTYELSYASNGSDDTGYDEDEWRTRTLVKRPDGSYLTQYFDEVYQPLSRVITDQNPSNQSPKVWATFVDRNSKGVVVEERTPANITAYDHSQASFTASSTAGLIWTYVLVGSSNMEEGYVADRKYQQGTGGAAYLDGSWAYGYTSWQVDGSESDSTVVRPVLASRREYTQAITSGTTGSNLYQYTTTYHAASGRLLLAIKQVDTTLPAVTSGNNGSGSSEVTKRYLNKDGTLAFERSPSGLITYHEYTNGQVTKLIEDADTTKTGSGEDFENVSIPTGFSSSGTPLHHKTTYAYDAQGRQTQVTADDRTQLTYFTKLGDQRPVMLLFNDYETSPTTKYYGPVRYTVTNHAGRVEVEGVIALTNNESTAALTSFIDETDADPITAVDAGTVAQIQTSHYDEPGTQLEEAREYSAIPSSEPGTDGTHYDPTKYGYDAMGRQWREKDPHGTIYRTVFDKLGRVTERWIGTNDYSFSGGEPSGTDNMVRTELLEYDSGNDKGNSYLTKRTLYVQDSDTGKRETSFSNDLRGNVLLETEPAAPYAFHKYDNMSRRIATGLFSSTANIDVTTDDPTTETSNRLALSESSYDDLGRSWRDKRHKIDASDGSDDDNLEQLHWYDADGRLVKTDGQQLESSSTIGWAARRTTSSSPATTTRPTVTRMT